MSIQRFSLYGSYRLWNENIQADPSGRWVQWKHVEPYIEYCLSRGVSFEEEQLELPFKEEEAGVIEKDDHELPSINDYMLDTYEYMTRNVCPTSEEDEDDRQG